MTKTESLARATALASTAGIGLRHGHYAQLLQGPVVPLPFVEVHAENFFAAGGAALAVLTAARERWPLSLHGVGLSLGAAAGLDPWHLSQLAALVERFDPVLVSDHACFARAPLRRHGVTAEETTVHAADLLPLAYNDATLAIMVAHVQQVQERLRRPLLVENISAYLAFLDDHLAEPEFFNLLAQRTGCGVLLDVNNLFVNALNRQRAGGESAAPTSVAAAVAACHAWIDALNPAIVGECHLAGFHDAGDTVIDDHGSAVREPVWQVFQHALRKVGAVPTLVEWDNALPPLQVLLDQARIANVHLAEQAHCQDGFPGSAPVTR